MNLPSHKTNDTTASSLEFKGQVALVTGAAQGIGRAVADALARAGARVAALDVQPERIETVAAELRAHGEHCLGLGIDVRDAPALHAAVQRIERELGPIDVLVNVAGVLRPGSIFDSLDADWADSFAVNTHGVIGLCRAVGRAMRERRSGSIVTVGSNAATTPRIGLAAYAASKAATLQFMRCLALELAPHGVRCNTVSPGSTDTAMQQQLWPAGASAQAAAEAVIRGSPDAYRLGIPLQRIARPSDVADAVCFLASARARHITMHDLRVDGGATFDA